MARGKKAASAANRRAEAAHEVIDRLTTELADAKMRARDAEKRAAKADQLEELLAQRNDDEIVADLVATIQRWKRIQKADAARRKKAIDEIWKVLAKDLRGLMKEMEPGFEDTWEFVMRRYPAIMNALAASDGAAERVSEHVDRRGLNPTIAKLDDEKIKKWQEARGYRAVAQWAPDRDFADVMADLLDASQIGFTADEMVELTQTTAGG